jgi:hypothetical protein
LSYPAVTLGNMEPNRSPIASRDAVHPKLWPWFNAHPELAITGLLFTAVAVRIMSVSGGHVATAQALLRHGPVTVLVGTVFAFVPSVLGFFAAFALLKWLRGYIGRGSKEFRATPMWLMAALLSDTLLSRIIPFRELLGLLAVPVAFLILDFIRVVRKGQPFEFRSNRWGERFTAPPAVWIGSLVISFFFAAQMWLPTEVLETPNRRTVAYILEDEGEWITIVRENNRRLAYVRADSVLSRQVCDADQLATSPPLWSENELLEEECLEALS